MIHAAATPAPLILLVEDHEANIQVTTILLEYAGYACHIARTGTEALERFKNNFYAAVLMDLQIPHISGLEATRLMREFEAEHERKPTPIIGLTAHAAVVVRHSCLAAGMNDYLAKPFSSDALKDMLRRYCSL